MSHLAISRPALALLVFIVLIGAAAAAAYIYLPRARVTITPTTVERSVEQSITLSQATQDPDFLKFVLPARVVEAEVEEQTSITRDAGTVTEDFARGTVTIINQQADEQPLLPQTHLKHVDTGAYALTDKSVRVPPQGSVDVSVTAEEKGAVGNIPAGRFIIDRLPAALHDQIYAESTVPLTGGEVVEHPLTEAEINNAKQTVAQALEGRLQGELTAKAGGATILPGLTSIERDEPIISAAAGSRATVFTVKQRARARALIVEENDVLSLTLLTLRNAPKENEEFVSYNPDSFDVSIVRADFERGEARIAATLTGNFAQKTPPTIFDAQPLAGRTPDEVKEYFKKFDSVANVEVALSPFWVTTVPPRPSATEIIVKNTEKSP